MEPYLLVCASDASSSPWAEPSLTEAEGLLVSDEPFSCSGVGGFPVVEQVVGLPLGRVDVGSQNGGVCLIYSIHV